MDSSLVCLQNLVVPVIAAPEKVWEARQEDISSEYIEQ